MADRPDVPDIYPEDRARALVHGWLRTAEDPLSFVKALKAIGDVGASTTAQITKLAKAGALDRMAEDEMVDRVEKLFDAHEQEAV